MLYASIEKLCKENHVSIARLERECELGNATIRGWKTSSPRLDNLIRVADFFKVSIDSLIADREEK